MSSAQAPGKIILFGEHAVVYGQPALAAPVTQVSAEVRIAAARRSGIWIEAPDIKVDRRLEALPTTHPIAVTIRNTLAALKASPPQAVTITIHSTIPVASGLGSGAAVSVALVRALAAYLQKRISNRSVNALAYETEKIHHGTPSGIDNTVITYARPVFFIKGQPIRTIRVRRPFTIVIGDTGVCATTREAVADVRTAWEHDPARFERLFESIGTVAKSARRAMQTGTPERLGPLMSENHALLQEMGVSSPELDHLVNCASKAGALGAKLSGGGRGGNMIALVPDGGETAVAESLLQAGARKTITTTIDPKGASL